MQKPDKKKSEERPEGSGLRARVHEVIFEADTFWGKAFDVVLLVVILLSVLIVTLETVKEVEVEIGPFLRAMEWVLTGLFTLEYLARVISVKKPHLYMISFYGVIDLLSILPTYISIFVSGTQGLIVIRMLRLLRVFRIFKLVRHLNEARTILAALKASRPKIIVFLIAVLSLTVIMGTLMYLVEGASNDRFTSIPRSIYWAIVTLTTVGYGDIAPETVPGQILASAIMILGYAIIAVPTGIVTGELISETRHQEVDTRACPACGKQGHEKNADYCKYCGSKL